MRRSEKLESRYKSLMTGSRTNGANFPPELKLGEGEEKSLDGFEKISFPYLGERGEGRRSLPNEWDGPHHWPEYLQPT